MKKNNRNPDDKLLFTPGPLTTTQTVKEQMLSDLGSRDSTFINIIADIRTRLLRLGNVSKKLGYETVIIQGSGTYGIEAVISSALPEGGHLLLIINGAYGERMLKIANIHGIKTSIIRYPENQIPIKNEIESALQRDPSITHLATVHCETTTGIINDVNAIGKIASKHNKTYIVDAMSSFGGIPLDIRETGIDFLISSSNKCIEGVPGFSFVIVKKSKLKQTRNNARTLTLDLYDQWDVLERTGQFRFTPPVQVIKAFLQALIELDNEGGISARAERYRKNFTILSQGMSELGFEMYLSPEHAGYIITSFRYPRASWFDFNDFYKYLSDRDLVIYPGKLTKDYCFRIGNIGQLYPQDIKKLLKEIQKYKEIKKA